MNMKERLVTLLMTASGMLGLGSANAQEDNAPTKTDSTELSVNLEGIKPTTVAHNESLIYKTWLRSDEGKKAVDAYMNAMDYVGEPKKLNEDQYKFLMSLSKMDRSLFSIGETDYVFKAQDLKEMKPDSLGHVIAENFDDALTPSRYPGRFCGHAAKVIIGPTGAAPEALGIESACELIPVLRENPNFVELKTEIDEKPEDVKCLPVGTWKVYGKTKKHNHGHTGFTNENGGDTSDKSRIMIDPNNYSGVHCFVTAGYEVGLQTYFNILAERSKKSQMSEMMILENTDNMNGVKLGTVTPEAMFHEATAARELALSLFNSRNNDDKRVSMPYVFGQSVKVARIAKGALRGGKVKKGRRSSGFNRRLAQARIRGRR